jgi:parvulin-like peptidyl-prolyl isomerase
LRNIAAVALVTAFALAAAACGGKGSNAGKDVAATVDGKEITLAEVDRIVNQQAQAQGQQLTTLQQAAARLTVLDRLIERHVLFARAEKEKTVPTDDEVATFVNQQRQQVTAEDWEKGLRENSLTEDQVRDEARKDLAIRKLQEKVYGKITIRDQEITDFYNSNRPQFVNPRGVYLSDIVVDAADSGGAFRDDAKSDAEATAKIQRLYATLKGGADFADVARTSSEDQSGARGGDIGMANEQTLQQYGFPAELIGRLFNQMTVGSYTEPIRFADGRWYIFKLTNRQLENKPLALEDPGVKDQIRQALINQRQQILQAALVSNAMSDVKVANRLAENMLNDPNNLGGNQPAGQGAPASTPAPAATQSATPAASASPEATPSAAASPSASATPAGAARPASTPRPAATAAATPAGSAPRPAATATPQR